MPCPPSYEEQRFMALDREIEVVHASLQRQSGEMPDTMRFLSLIDWRICTPAQKAQAEHLQGELVVLLTDVQSCLSPFDYPATWPTLEDVERYERHVGWLTRVDQDIELRLCEARTFLYVHGKKLIRHEEWLLPDMEARWTQEIERHRLHREEDRAAAIIRLQKAIEYYTPRVHQTDLSPTQRASAAEILAANRAKLERIQSIPLESLLGDRDLLFD